MLADPLIDRTINRWHILDHLGEGGMATVLNPQMMVRL